MYSLLIKDRGFPVHLYLQHMMKVMNVSRAEAAKGLGNFAFKAGLKESSKVPLNNTMSDWLRNPQKTPQWAVVSSMCVLEKLNRVPQTDQEWAFWSISRIESGDANDSLPQGWPVTQAKKWLQKAATYTGWYSKRSTIRQAVENCTNPLLATKIIYTVLGDGENSATFPDVFFSIDESLLGQEQIASSLRNEVSLSKFQVEHVRLNDKKAHQIYIDIKQQLKELAAMSVVKEHEDSVIIDTKNLSQKELSDRK